MHRKLKQKSAFFQKIKSIIQNLLCKLRLDFIKQCTSEGIVNLQCVLNSKSKLQKIDRPDSGRLTSHFEEHLISRFLNKEQC